MNYQKLLQYFYKFKNALFDNKHEKIDLIIAPTEIIVRGILHPFFFSQSKNKLKESVFLPPPDSKTVSLNRLRYADATFCKQHAKAINFPDNIYCGLASICVGDIIKISQLIENITVEVIASPMDINRNYFNLSNNKIFVNTLGFPMHCDLTYDTPIVAHAPNTLHRKMAKELLKATKYYHDEHPLEDIWNEHIPLHT